MRKHCGQSLFLLPVALIACEPEVASTTSRVVYGADDRTEVYAAPAGPHRTLAENAIAMELSRSVLDLSRPSAVTVTYTRTLGEAQTLCPGERYADQIEPGTCSGTLVDARHLLTAGHCMDGPTDCDGTRVWLFGFQYQSAGVMRPLTLADVYRCTRVVALRNDATSDYAIVELDRPVLGRTPAVVRRAASPPPIGTPVTLIGHPNGIPMKIAGGATINTVSGLDLWADVDAFRANSGSGVFDAAGQLVALLQGGATDYAASGACFVVNVLEAGSGGEHLVAVQAPMQAYCATPGGATSPACGCTVNCDPRLPGDLCDTAAPLAGTSATFTATLTGYGADATGTCGGAGSERYYRFTVDARSNVSVRTSGLDTVLYLLRGCGGAEIACDDDISSTDRGSQINATLDPGTYVLVLDAYGLAVGDATVQFNVTPLSGSDAGTSDASAVPDAGRDAGPAPADGGAESPVDGGTTVSPGGCACATAPGTVPVPARYPWLFALWTLECVRRARRRRGSPGGPASPGPTPT